MLMTGAETQDLKMVEYLYEHHLIVQGDWLIIHIVSHIEQISRQLPLPERIPISIIVQYEIGQLQTILNVRYEIE